MTTEPKKSKNPFVEAAKKPPVPKITGKKFPAPTKGFGKPVTRTSGRGR